jgi:hypothetical protein
MTGNNFVGALGSQSLLMGDGSVVTPFVAARDPAHAHGGVQLDRVYFDLSFTSLPLVGGTMLPAIGKMVGGFAKNGCCLIVLVGSTPVEIDLTALGSFTGLTSQAGDTSLARANCLIFNNIGATDLAVAPGLTIMPGGASGTVRAGGALCSYDPTGLAVVAGTNNLIIVTPTTGGVLAFGYGGA